MTLGASGTASGGDLVIVEMTVGELTMRNVRASRSPRSRRALLGMNVSGQHCCHFRFSTNELQLDSQNNGGGAQHDLTRQSGGLPFVDVDFGAVTTHACWDIAFGR